MDKLIIALSGKSMVGKDTLAMPLIKQGFMHGSFAYNLKEMCQTIFNLPPILTDTQEGKQKRLEVPRRLTNGALKDIIRWMSRTHNLEHKASLISEIKDKYVTRPTLTTGKTTEFKTARELLQTVGTEICRTIIDTYHIDVLIDKIRNSNHNKWVITDARFPNEREALKELGALTVLIKRPSLDSQSTHISELSLGSDEEYDVVMINDGSIEELQEKAKVFTRL